MKTRACARTTSPRPIGWAILIGPGGCGRRRRSARQGFVEALLGRHWPHRRRSGLRGAGPDPIGCTPLTDLGLQQANGLRILGAGRPVRRALAEAAAVLLD